MLRPARRLCGTRFGLSGRTRGNSVTVARREIRKWLSESAQGQRVEELVDRLLGSKD